MENPGNIWAAWKKNLIETEIEACGWMSIVGEVAVRKNILFGDLSCRVTNKTSLLGDNMFLLR